MRWFGLKVQFRCTHTKEVESQALLHPDPRTRGGGGQWAGGRAVVGPTSRASRKWKSRVASTCYLEGIGAKATKFSQAQLRREGRAGGQDSGKEIWGRHVKLWFLPILSKYQDSGCEQGCHCEKPRQQLKIAVFPSQRSRIEFVDWVSLQTRNMLTMIPSP